MHFKPITFYGSSIFNLLCICFMVSCYILFKLLNLINLVSIFLFDFLLLSCVNEMLSRLFLGFILPCLSSTSRSWQDYGKPACTKILNIVNLQTPYPNGRFAKNQPSASQMSCWIAGVDNRMLSRRVTFPHLSVCYHRFSKPCYFDMFHTEDRRRRFFLISFCHHSFLKPCHFDMS